MNTTSFVGARNYYYTGLNSVSSSEKNYRGWLPEAGTTIRWNKNFATGLTYSKAYQTPTLSQLYPDGQHFPGNFYLPNASLVPEQSENIELNVRFNTNNTETGISLYKNDAKNFISQTISQTTTQFTNLEKVISQGIEGYAYYNFHKVRSGFNFDFHKHEDGTNDSFLINQSPNRINWLIGYNPTSSLNFNFMARNLLPQKRVTSGLPTPSRYWLFDSRISYSTEWLKTPLFFNFTVNNILNRQYFTPGSTLAGPGTEVFFSINIEV